MMKKIYLILWLMSTSVLGFSQMTNIPQGLVEFKTMTSEVLKAERNYAIYLPKSYTEATDKRYPVLYLLHGLYGNGKDWVERGHLQDVANKLIDAESAVEMIIVVPDAGTDWNGYFNMEGWSYETYFFQELIPFIEDTYRTIPNKENRAIAGLSMGGGGATVYAQKYPEMFSSVYAMSALMGLEPGGGIPAKDKKMEELNRTVIENHAVHFVTDANEKTIHNLRDIRWFVDCGDDDFLLDVNLAFYQAMQKAKVPSELRVRDGGHDWEYWHSALYLALPFISNGFN